MRRYTLIRILDDGRVLTLTYIGTIDGIPAGWSFRKVRPV